MHCTAPAASWQQDDGLLCSPVLQKRHVELAALVQLFERGFSDQTDEDLICLQGVSLPASQTVPNYALLALVYGSVLLAKRIRPVNAWTSYAGVALLDVEGNFLVVSSPDLSPVKQHLFLEMPEMLMK